MKMLTGCKNKLDAILFSGSAPYDYARRYLKMMDVPNYYLNRYSGALLRAILQASLEGYDINKISFDYFDLESLSDVCDNLGIRPDRSNILSYQDVREQRLHLDYYNETVFKFHRDKWKKGKSACAITPCFGAYQMLQKLQIPSFFVYPTADVCRAAINRLRSEYMEKINQKSQIVILSIEINLPNEYSLFMQHEQSFMQDRNSISSYIYALAGRLEASITEPTYRNFLIFTTREILETVTDHLQSLDILNLVQEHFLVSLCIGIGYGDTVRKAKENANKALIQAKKYGSNIAFAAYGENNIRGPVGKSKMPAMDADHDKLDKQIELISSRTSVSMQNIFKLYSIIEKTDKSTFTTKDLSVLMHVSKRSVDRIVNKLEIAGYLHIVGKQAAYDVGRPSRIVKIDFHF